MANMVMYPAELVMPMKAELTDKGFKTLQLPEQVMTPKQSGTTLVMVNSCVRLCSRSSQDQA